MRKLNKISTNLLLNTKLMKPKKRKSLMLQDSLFIARNHLNVSKMLTLRIHLLDAETSIHHTTTISNLTSVQLNTRKKRLKTLERKLTPLSLTSTKNNWMRLRDS